MLRDARPSCSRFLQIIPIIFPVHHHSRYHGGLAVVGPAVERCYPLCPFIPHGWNEGV